MPGKTVCETCFAQLAKSQENKTEDISDIIRKVVREEVMAHSSTSQQAEKDQESIDTDRGEDDEAPCLFDFRLTSPFITAIKEALDWAEPTGEEEQSREYYSHLSKKLNTFPIMREIRNLILEEWKKVENKTSFHNRFSKLYPLKDEEVPFLLNPPTIDASLSRLAKHVTLPREDSAIFKDPLERRVDNDLKRSYVSAGATCKPAIALTSVAKALKVWTSNIEQAVQQDADKEEILSAMEDLKITADFVGEASMDILRSLSRIMLNSVTAKRAMWLKSWRADMGSKQNWVKIPYDGVSLFGNEMDKAISRVTGGKSGLIPQDRPQKRNFPPNRKQNTRFKDARTYRPGKPFRGNWKSSQSSLARSLKSNTSSSGQTKQSF
ncbi:lamina-associated polypeptide 2-like [Hyperolius riggenbachi]|uniref:lamina-associated polypeptide 2-like n=1 Tax=Hyperolius riggenbachi TaxID=752182 RepID=UPI0035A397FD